MTRRAREKLWLPLCLMQLRGHIPPSTGWTGKKKGGKHNMFSYLYFTPYTDHLQHKLYNI
nr:MAG TPA: hypothetical protein [Caudoviricetes sp.]